VGKAHPMGRRGDGGTPMSTQVVHRRQYDYDGFLAHCAKTPLIRSASSRSVGDRSWAGTSSFDEAMALARKGWPEGLKDIQKVSEAIWNVVGQEIQKVETLFDVCGAFADVDRYLTGEPEDMVQFVEEQTFGRGKVVKLFVNNAASCGVSAKTMFCRGAAVVALIDALEKLGYSCEVSTADALAGGWRGDNQLLQYEVELRGAGQVLDMDRMAFALAHPSWLRRMVFSAMEQEDATIRSTFKIGGGYGHPSESRGLTSDEHGIDVPSLRYGTHHWQSQDAAIKWVLDAAAKVLGRPVVPVA
jgi:hypothetical protein